MRKKLTTEEVISRSMDTHGNRYDYSLTEYNGYNDKIIIICKIHGEFSQQANNHISGQNCPLCKSSNTKTTNLKRYGVGNPAQNKDVYDKVKKTNLVKYGAENPTQNKDVRDKVKKTNLERYGCEHPLQNKDVYDKVKKTNLERYGCETPWGSTEIQQTRRKNNLERYGCEYPTQCDLIKNKTKDTNALKYGTDYRLQSHMVDILPLIEDKEWLFEQYITLGKTAVQIAQELNIHSSTIGEYLKQHEIEIRYTVGYSMKCIQWLESIMQQEQIFIQHAGNIGEYHIPGTRFKVDGYCGETNTCYEFHGDIFHGNPDLFEDTDTPNFYNKEITAKELYTKTKERETRIKELGYNLVVMWENDFNQQSKFS